MQDFDGADLTFAPGMSSTVNFTAALAQLASTPFEGAASAAAAIGSLPQPAGVSFITSVSARDTTAADAGAVVTSQSSGAASRFDQCLCCISYDMSQFKCKYMSVTLAVAEPSLYSNVTQMTSIEKRRSNFAEVAAPNLRFVTHCLYVPCVIPSYRCIMKRALFVRPMLLFDNSPIMEQSDEDKNQTGATASKTGSSHNAFAANVTTARDHHASHIAVTSHSAQHSALSAATPRPFAITATDQSSLHKSALHDVIHDVIAEEVKQTG